MNDTRHALKAALLIAIAFPLATPAEVSTTATAELEQQIAETEQQTAEMRQQTAELYQQAYCSAMKTATIYMEIGKMDEAKQKLRDASEHEKAYLASGGVLALDAGECPGVKLAATYESGTSPEIGGEAQIARQRRAEQERKTACQKPEYGLKDLADNPYLAFTITGIEVAECREIAESDCGSSGTDMFIDTLGSIMGMGTATSDEEIGRIALSSPLKNLSKAECTERRINACEREVMREARPIVRQMQAEYRECLATERYAN